MEKEEDEKYVVVRLRPGVFVGADKEIFRIVHPGSRLVSSAGKFCTFIGADREAARLTEECVKLRQGTIYLFEQG